MYQKKLSNAEIYIYI